MWKSQSINLCWGDYKWCHAHIGIPCRGRRALTSQGSLPSCLFLYSLLSFSLALSFCFFISLSFSLLLFCSLLSPPPLSPHFLSFAGSSSLSWSIWTNKIISDFVCLFFLSFFHFFSFFLSFLSFFFSYFLFFTFPPWGSPSCHLAVWCMSQKIRSGINWREMKCVSGVVSSKHMY